MVVFYTENSHWERFDAEVFPRPDVAEAIRPFVPVKVDAEDGEGRPLAEKYKGYVGAISPMILFLDPANREAEGGGVVARIPGMIPTGTLVEGLQTIARLPRDIDALARKAHPDDGEAMRRLDAWRSAGVQGRHRADRSRLGARRRPGLRSLGRGLQRASASSS